ncbi:MAG: hypothetical protein CMG55_08420 [Candidatus Marinimicrobia bacterium]|nr:hypothetical protein [Candidatus Neomarinimicrobiota bacterium]|tara:strand:- start:2967 stop:4253 length:1287 start_codon:yes stop_codon:yes gene_type:complete
MNLENIRINKFSCRFEDKSLEKEYLKYRWNKIWKNIKILLYVDTPLGFIIRIDDIFVQGVGKNIYYLSYHLFSIILLLVFLFSSNENKRKYHQEYFLITAIGFMNCGAWTYYFSNGQFPVGAGVLPIMIMLYLIVFPFHLINGLIAVIGTSIPFVILLLSQGNISLDQLPYLLFLPSIFLIANKRNREIDFRRDFYQTKTLEANRKLMQETLKRYFGESLTEKILDNKGDLKGDNIWVSISFTDITSYSTIIEHMSPETAVKFLNEYFSAMHDVIEKHNGQIINYIGDSVMVVFGAPQKLEDHEILSVQCAIGMRKKLNELNQKWNTNEFSRYWKNHGIDGITARTGIHTGSVIAGNIGSDRMLQYSTIGDTVNVASRLEQRNKEFSTNILFSHEIYTSLTKALYDKAKYQGDINLKGRDNKTKVYSI